MPETEKYLIVAGTYQDGEFVSFIAVREKNLPGENPFVLFGGIDEQAPRALGIPIGYRLAHWEYLGKPCALEFVDDTSRINKQYLEKYCLRPLTETERSNFMEWYERGQKNFAFDLERSKKSKADSMK